MSDHVSAGGSQPLVEQMNWASLLSFFMRKTSYAIVTGLTDSSSLTDLGMPTRTLSSQHSSMRLDIMFSDVR